MLTKKEPRNPIEKIRRAECSRGGLKAIQEITAEMATKISGKPYNDAEAEDLKDKFEKICGYDGGFKELDEQLAVFDHLDFFKNYLTVLDVKVRVLAGHKAVHILNNVTDDDINHASLGQKRAAVKDFARIMSELQQAPLLQFNLTQINNICDVEKIREKIKQTILDGIRRGVIDVDTIDVENSESIPVLTLLPERNTR